MPRQRGVYNTAIPKRGRGAPTTLTRAIADAILWRVAEGESIKAIARSDDMPPFQVIFHWSKQNPEFADRLLRAREIASHAYAEQVLEVAFDESRDITPEGHPNNAAVQRDRLKADGLKWMAAKYNPAVYGDKQIHVGPDGMSAIQVQHTYDATLLEPGELTELRRLLRKMRGVTLDME